MDEIQDKILSGEFTAADWAWWKGQKNWVTIRNLPGLQFQEVKKEVEKEEVLVPAKEEVLSKEGSKAEKVAEKADQDDVTVQDFRVEYVRWIYAGFWWVIELFRSGLWMVALNVMLPPMILLSLMMAINSNVVAMVVCSVLLPVAVGPWNWFIMQRFRNKPLERDDIMKSYMRAPKQLFMLGVIQQIPIIPLLFIQNQDLALRIGMVISLILSLLFFYTIPLLMDKQMSLINAIMVSTQAIIQQIFPMLAYMVLVILIVTSGIFFFFVGFFFTALAGYASTVYAYLWVFDRESLGEIKLPGQNPE